MLHKARAKEDMLVSVAYCPNTVVRVKRKLVSLSPLVGCVGETRRDFIDKAIAGVNKALAENKPIDNILVPVRFPIAGPNSRLKFWMNDRDLLDPIQLEEEGVMISPYDLYQVDKKPVSFYKGIKLKEATDVNQLGAGGCYLYTHSRSTLRRALHSLTALYPKHYFWLDEAGLSTGPGCVFYQARFYSIDTIIPVYDPSELKGVVVEIITRPWPSKDLRDNHVRSLRLRSRVMLLTSTEEYVEYMDGVHVAVEEFGVASELQKIDNLMVPKSVKMDLTTIDSWGKAATKSSKPQAYKYPPLEINPPTISFDSESATSTQIMYTTTSAANISDQ